MTEPTSPQDPGRGRLIRIRNLRAAALNGKGLNGKGLVPALPAGFNGRWTRRHWAHASLFAMAGALVMAIVPGFSNAMSAGAPSGTSAMRTTMSLGLPPLPLARRQAPAADNWQVVSVASGETLSHLFERLDLSKTDLHRVLDQDGAKQALTRLRPGTELAFDIASAGANTPAALRAFRYDRDDTHRVELRIDGDKVVEKVIERPVETRTVVISGKVGRSLFHSARKLGLSGNNIATLTDEIFKYDIDFNSDVAASDRFSVVVEQSWREGELIRSGPILAATFTAHGDLHSGFRYVRSGKAEYFSADGRPLKKAFIRMPVSYTRISSRFTSARKHPILGRVRAHQGVDFAAPTGTPVMAAGDARVAFVGWKGGYGRAVILDHGRGYTTLYGHMSAFGKIKVGQRIPQGTVIGRVGSTGLATGPHLHYEFRINGVHRNPMSVTMPPPEPLRGAQLAEFRAQTGPALARIEKVERIIYAQVGDDGKDKRVASAAKPGSKKG
ncbi:MAG TPA: M23 family metallopeptidase [Luteimonas sp.]|nr:M23 family metallopeptidase [Luteimonas sp.]